MRNMEPVTIRHCTVDDLYAAPNRQELLDEYAAESSILGVPYAPQWHMYQQMEAVGALRFIGAFQDENLVGFVTVLTSVLPHYGVRASTTESLFVTKIHRRTGAGIRLLRAAEKHAQESGSAGLLISTPAGGILERVLAACEPYKHSNTVFYRSFQ